MTWVFLSLGNYLSWGISPVNFFFSQDVLNLINSKEGRSIPSFWNSASSQEITAPSLDIYSSLGISLFGLICQLFFSKNKRQNIPLLFFVTVIFLMALYPSVALGSRAPIIVLISSFCLSIIYLQYISLSENSGKKRIIALFIYLMIIIFCLISFNLILSNVSHLFDNISVGSRLAEKGLDTNRYDAWIYAINQMSEFPWGGRVMKLPPGIFYVHNIWLDQLYDAGIIPMILLIGFHLLQIPILLDFFKLKLPLTIHLFVICIIVSFLSSFIQAPVLQSSIPFFASSCFFFGSIMRLVIDNYDLQKNHRKC